MFKLKIWFEKSANTKNLLDSSSKYEYKMWINAISISVSKKKCNTPNRWQKVIYNTVIYLKLLYSITKKVTKKKPVYKNYQHRSRNYRPLFLKITLQIRAPRWLQITGSDPESDPESPPFLGTDQIFRVTGQPCHLTWLTHGPVKAIRYWVTLMVTPAPASSHVNKLLLLQPRTDTVLQHQPSYCYLTQK